MIAIHHKISGKVQGVAYRAFVRDAAQNLGIVGWVKNLKDGSVECLACADEQDLDVFEAQLKQGPRWSKVDRIEKEELIENFGLKSFEIK